MTKARRAEPEAPAADLSEAARAVVHDQGDPRIDAHLAALGLGEDTPPGNGRRGRAESLDTARVAELTQRMTELEAALQAARTRARTLVLGLGAAVVAIALLVLALVAR